MPRARPSTRPSSAAGPTQWQAAAAKAGADAIRIGAERRPRDGRPIAIASARSWPSRRRDGRASPLWIVLIGHGTFDGREAKFNLRGPDVTDPELAEWLATVKRPVAVLDCSSASGPFLNRLSGENRVIVTATRSGNELNYARFGQYLAEAIADPQRRPRQGRPGLAAGGLSTRRASRVEEYYQARARSSPPSTPCSTTTATGSGTPADWFRGVRATRRAKDGAPPDGLRAHQLHLIPSDRERQIPPAVRRRRDELELAVAALRDRKARLDDEAYYRQLEPLMLELGRLYRQTEAAGTTGGLRPG